MRLDNLRKEYKTVLGEADAIRKNYTNTSEAMSDDDAARFDAAMEKADKLEAEIAREEKAASRKAFSESVDEAAGMRHTSGEPLSGDERDVKQLKAFGEFLKFGYDGGSYSEMSRELKTLQADLDTQGGYLVAPQVFVRQLLKNVDDQVAIRRLATVISLGSAESLGVPSLDTDMGDADWTSELATGSEDSLTRFGKRELRPHPFAKRTKISNKLLRAAVMNPEDHVRERLAYKFAVTEEKGFMTGSGAEQPLGLFTASAQGISTARDTTVGTATSITADGLIDVKHTLKAVYWPRSTWIFHRDAIKMIRKLKDGNGQYIWQPGLTGGLPNTILDVPYVASEYAPNTFTASQYVGIIGDMKFYWIADALGLTVQRVVELYAEQNATGFIGRAEADGMPVLEEAFCRATLAAS